MLEVWLIAGVVVGFVVWIFGNAIATNRAQQKRWADLERTEKNLHEKWRDHA